MPQLAVIDGNDSLTTIETLPPVGPSDRAAALPTAWANEDLAVITGLGTKLDTQSTTLTGLGTKLDTQSTTLTALGTKLDALGIKMDTLNTTVQSPTPSAVFGFSAVKDIIFTTPTTTLAAGDVAADTQVLANFFRANDAEGMLQSITLTDEDDQGANLYIVIFQNNSSLGTEDSPPSVTDANGRNILGTIKVDSADWVDLGGIKIWSKTGLGLGLRPNTGTADIYVAILVGATSTPTYTVNGLRGHFYSVA